MEFNHHTIARNSLWIWRFIIENTKALCVWYQFVSDLAKAWENMRSEKMKSADYETAEAGIACPMVSVQ